MLYTPVSNALLESIKRLLINNNYPKSALMMEERSLKIMPERAEVDRLIVTLDSKILPYSFIRHTVMTLTPNDAAAIEFIEEHILNAISPSEVFMIGCDGNNIEYYVEHEGGALRSYDAGKALKGIYNHMPKVYYAATYQQIGSIVPREMFDALQHVIPLHELAHVFNRYHPDFRYAYHMSTTRCPRIKDVADNLLRMALICNPLGGGLPSRQFLHEHANDVLAWLSIGVRNDSSIAMNIYVRPATWLQGLMRTLLLS
jgi:hypothetical protein